MSKTPPPGAIDYEAACSLLGLPCAANPSDIDDAELKKAFRKAALKAHPDKGGSDEEFRKVKAASECIVRAKKHGIARAADATYDSDNDDDANFEAFFDEEGDGRSIQRVPRTGASVTVNFAPLPPGATSRRKKAGGAGSVFRAQLLNGGEELPSAPRNDEEYMLRSGVKRRLLSQWRAVGVGAPAGFFGVALPVAPDCSL